MLAQEPVIGKDNVIIPVDVIDAISKFSNTVRTTGIIVISFLSLFSLLIILMIIGFKIRIKRREIEIMKLLGATSWFIRAPFILEGIFYSSFGAFVAWVMSYLILWYATPWIQEAIKDVSLLPISPIVMLELLLIGQLIAVVIGFVGSYGAIRRYLHL
jgi:cell division transport system permease protein